MKSRFVSKYKIPKKPQDKSRPWPKHVYLHISSPILPLPPTHVSNILTWDPASPPNPSPPAANTQGALPHPLLPAFWGPSTSRA